MLLIESVEECVRLRESNKSDDWQRFKRDEAPLWVWLGVIRNHPDMRRWVPFNRMVPAEVLRALVCDSDSRTRSKIASNRYIPADILELLSYDEEDTVARAVAGNPLSPVSALERLRNHPWHKVRERVEKQLVERGVEGAKEGGG